MNKEINLLYRFNENESNQFREGDESSYEILQVFTPFGPLPQKMISTVYREFEKPHFIVGSNLLFSSLEDLGRFIIELLKEADSGQAYLLSTEDYNIGLDSCNDSEQFQDIFRRYGTLLENPEGSVKKKSLFGNLFNK